MVYEKFNFGGKIQKATPHILLNTNKITDKSDILSLYSIIVAYVYQFFHVKKFVFVVLLLAMLATCASAATLNVGAGQTYATSGSSDQVAINNAIQAAQPGDTVYLHPGTYIINQPIRLKSGVTLAGAGFASTTIKALAWDTFISGSMIQVFGVNTVTIYGLTINGNEPSLTIAHSDGHAGHGDGFNGIHIAASSGVTIHDMYATAMDGDFVRLDHIMDASGYDGASSDITIYNCQVLCCGHDAVEAWGVNTMHIYNIKVDIFINAGIRIASGCTNVEVDHCTFFCDTGSGNAAFELENAVSNPYVHHCIIRNIHNTVSRAFTTVSASGSIRILNNVMWDCPSGYLPSGLTVTESGNIYPPGNPSESVYVAQGYGYGSVYNSTGGYIDDGGQPLPVYNGAALPTLTQPTDGQVLQAHSGQITFAWSNVNSTSYHVQISNVSNFATTLFDTTTSATSLNEPMGDGSYYWRLAAKNDVNGQFTAYTTVAHFNVSGNTNVPAEGTGLYGVVYNTNTNNPIQGAVVTIVNETAGWSTTIVTDSSGLYSTSVADGVYYVYAAAQDYQSTIVGTGLPITVEDGYRNQNIALVKSQTYFPPNMVNIRVQSILNQRYEGVMLDVYRSGSSSVDQSGTTDSNGEHAFDLEQKTSYSIHAYSTERNIDKTVTIDGGAAGTQIILVWGATNPVDTVPVTPIAGDYIQYGVSQSFGDMTHGYINISVASKDGSALAYITTIKSVYMNGTADNLYVNNFAKGNITTDTVSVIVPRNATYNVTTIVRHPALEEQHYYRQIEIRGSQIRKGLDLEFMYQWQYEAVLGIIMVLTAGLFGKRNETVGGLCIVLEGAFGLWSGWFAYDIAGWVMAYVGILWFFIQAIREKRGE